jgi:hypothetical protein
VTINNNPDGSFTVGHGYVDDAGQTHVAYEETYAMIDGQWVNDLGQTYVPVGDNNQPPPDGSYGVEHGADDSWTVVGSGDGDNDGGGSSNDSGSGSGGGSSASNDRDNDDGKDDGDDNDDSDNSDNSDDGGDGDKESEQASNDDGSDEDTESSEAEKSEEGTPVPDGYNNPRTAPGEIYRQTGGKVGGEEQRNTERAIEAGRGGHVGAPESGRGYVVVSKEQAQNDERAIGAKTGGNDAPEVPRQQPVSAADLQAIAQRIAGGGVVDPPEGGGGTSPGTDPTGGGTAPVGGGSGGALSGNYVIAIQNLSALQSSIANFQSTQSK